MMVLYKSYAEFITEHSVDPDKRRYILPQEGPRHFIDIDYYGTYLYTNLPRKWNDAVAKFSEDSFRANGIGHWWVQIILQRLINAFREKNQSKS